MNSFKSLKDRLILFLGANSFRKKLVLAPDDKLLNNSTIVSRVFAMAWPLTLESVLIALISMADSIMVAAVGYKALSAVGVTSQPRMLLLSIIMALNMAVTVIVSRRRGQEDQEGANRILKNAVVVSTCLALVINALGIIFAEPLLTFAGANSDYLSQSIVYFTAICVGNFFYSISLTITAAQRGAGNTKISMVTNLSANLVNIFFNYLLINGIWIFPRLEVLGAGIATAMGNMVALSIALYSVSRKDGFLYLKIFDRWTINFKDIKNIVEVAWPSLVEQVFLRVGFFTFAKQVFELGTLASSTHHIVMNVMNLSFSVGDGFAIAATALVGRSLGAQEKPMAQLYGKSSQHFGMVIAGLLALGIFLFRYPIILLFTTEPKIVPVAADLMAILAIICSFQMTQVITIGVLRGAGDLKFVAGLSMVSVMLIRPVLTYLLAYSLGFGIYGAWIAICIDQVMRWFVSRIRYHSGKWLSIVI